MTAGSRPPRRSASSPTRSRWAANSYSCSSGAARISSTRSVRRPATQGRPAAPGQLDMWAAGPPQASPNSALSSNRELDQRGAPPFGVRGPGTRRQVARVDGRAAGRVGDHESDFESWDSTFRYGVSPQPAHAPENSKAAPAIGPTHCAEIEPRAIIGRNRFEERDVLARGDHQRHGGAEVDRLGDRGPLTPTGQASTHKPQPVQSSHTPAAYNWAFGNAHGVDRRGVEPLVRPTVVTVIELGPDDTVRTHEGELPHWMQCPTSPNRDQVEMQRFSQAVVPLGKVPSAGNALTGSRFPMLAIISAVTAWTNSGADSGTSGAGMRVEVTRA